MGREARIASFTLSRSEKLRCFLKPFFICAAATSVWWPVDQLGSHQRCFSGAHVDEDFFFFQTEKKKSQGLSCKKQEVQPSLFSGVLQLTPMLFEYNLLLHSPLPPNGTPVLASHFIISLSRQTIGHLCPGNLQHLFQIRKEGHVVVGLEANNKMFVLFLTLAL